MQGLLDGGAQHKAGSLGRQPSRAGRTPITFSPTSTRDLLYRQTCKVKLAHRIHETFFVRSMMLRDNASEVEIGLPGRISVGL